METLSKDEFERKLSKKTFDYNIKINDLKIVNDYLEKVDKRSHGAYLNHKRLILDCLNFIQKPIESIQTTDIIDFFKQDIDNRIDRRIGIEVKTIIKLDTKESYRSYLKSFFNHVKKTYLSQQKNIYNPVPEKDIYEFTQQEHDVKRQSDLDDEIFTDDDLLEILQKAKSRNYRDFIIFSLITVTGARASEILTLKISDIDLEERYFETGFVKGARKSTMRTKESLLFYFPKNFVPYLDKYIKYLGKDQCWLFPGHKSYYGYSSFHDNVKRNYGSKYSKFHRFRKTLITRRVSKPFECPLWISEGLMNHASSSTEGKHYIKLSISEKREYYDQYFPYSHFPYF